MKNIFGLWLLLAIYSFCSTSFAGLEEDYARSNKTGVFSWLEKGQARALPTYYCSGFYLKTLFRQGLRAHEQAKTIQQWVDACKPQFNDNFRPKDLTVLYNFITLHTKMASNKLVRPVEITTKDGRVVKGILAMVPGEKKRPFVIGRCGVYCTALSGSTTNVFLSHLFEESNYNVLFLESMTSRQYSTTNKSISVSGFDEAGQMFELSQNLGTIDVKLPRVTSEVNFVGYSLGGHAALFASLVSSLNKSNIPIRSTLALCPVVDLQKQIDFLFMDRNPRGEIVTLFNRFLLKTINRLFPVFSDEELTNVPFNNDGMKKIVSVNNLRFYQRNTQNLYFSKLNPFKGVEIKDFDDIWRLSRWQDSANLTKTPTLVVGNGDDSVVSYPLNTAVINKDASKDLGVVSFAGGNHCGFDIYAGWGVASALTNGFLGNYSTYKREVVEIPFDSLHFYPRELEAVEDTPAVYSYTWRVNNPAEYAILQVFAAKKNASCIKDWRRQCWDDEIIPYEVRIKLSQLSEAGLPAKLKGSGASAMISRYLNVHAQVLGPNGRDWRIDPGMPSAITMPVREAVPTE